MIPTDGDLRDALKTLKARQPTYRLHRQYCDGQMRLAFATDSFRSAFGSLFRALAYNRCRTVVDAIADRLTVTGWETEAEGDQLIEQEAHALWHRTDMERRQGEVHQEALRAGDAYVIVWPNPDTGEAELAPNRAHCVSVVYDDDWDGEIAFAVKSWRIGTGELKGRWRLTVYTAESITRWITTGPRDEMPERIAGLMPYEDEYGAESPNPYGTVPVFHFANNADTAQPGASELVDVIPLQDGLNKTIADSLVAAEYLAYPQRWFTGVEAVLDPQTGQEINPFKGGMDRLWTIGDKDAKGGEFAPGDMRQFIEIADAWDLRISRVSHVPVHWLAMTGTPPSGESLKVAESPFVAKVRDRQISFGAVWSRVMRFALQVEGKGEDEVAGLVPTWASPETRSAQDDLDQALKKKAIGIPDDQVWSELGYSPEEVKQFKDLAQTRRDEQARQFTAGFNGGQIGG